MGKNRELQNAIIRFRNVNEAFSKLTMEEVESLSTVFMQRLKKSTEMFSRPTESFCGEVKRRMQKRDEQEGYVFRETRKLTILELRITTLKFNTHPVFIATQKNDNAERKKVAEPWSEYLNISL